MGVRGSVASGSRSVMAVGSKLGEPPNSKDGKLQFSPWLATSTQTELMACAYVGVGGWSPGASVRVQRRAFMQAMGGSYVFGS
jgi:hypothetical protein